MKPAGRSAAILAAVPVAPAGIDPVTNPKRPGCV